MSDADLKKQLMAALGINEEELKQLAVKVTGLPLLKKKAPEHGPVRLYKRVTKKSHCTHCGHQDSIDYLLSYGEHIIWANKEGRYKSLYISTKDSMEDITVDAYFTRCDMCAVFLRNLSRTQLEWRYLQMMKEVPNLFKLKFTEPPVGFEIGEQGELDFGQPEEQKEQEGEERDEQDDYPERVSEGEEQEEDEIS